jgi:hypothetical protein
VLVFFLVFEACKLLFRITLTACLNVFIQYFMLSKYSVERKDTMD